MVVHKLRSQLWQATDWAKPIAAQAAALVALGDAGDADDTLALARLAESLVAERRVAISLYRLAFAQGKDVSCMTRARQLAQELGDFSLVAELVELEYSQSREARLLILEALARLDAGQSEAAVGPLDQCLALFPNDSILPILHRAASGRASNLEDAIAALVLEAEGELKIVRAGMLLQAARLSRLLPGSDADTLTLLMRAFDAYPGDESVFSLLENRLIEDQDQKRLANLYRIRAKSVATKGRDVDVYRRAGSRLLQHPSFKGLGLRLLQEGVQEVYRRELEEGVSLVAMLSLIVKELLEAGAMPRAVRLLAQALAHPRSDDEVMWIVNNGLALAQGDVALSRTRAVFEAVRDRVLARNPEFEASAEDALKADALGEIDDELQELTRPAGLAASIAARMDISVDVQIAARAELHLESGPVVAMTRDLSSTGAFLACRATLALGERLRCKMMLPGEDDWSLVEHELEGVVARVESGVGYGIQFCEVPQAYLDDLQALHESMSG